MQQLQQLSIPAPGGQGLNSEITPFQPQSDFAIVADNAVVDRIGRLASREAFADYVTESNVQTPSAGGYDVVRMASVEVDEWIPPSHVVLGDAEYGSSEFFLSEWSGEAAARSDLFIQSDLPSEYGTAEFGESEWNGDSNTALVRDVVFGIIGTGSFERGAMAEFGISEFGDAEYTDGRVAGDLEPTEFVGFAVDKGRIRQIDNIRPSNGRKDAQLVPFKDSIFVFSKGDPAMYYYNGLADKISNHPDYIPPQDDAGIIAQEIDGDVACAAYGRLWVSGVSGNYDTVYYSDLLVPYQWYDGRGSQEDTQNTAGIIDVREYWPSGNDKIQGIAAHNGYLIIFGRHSILIYSGAQGDPAADGGLKLEDAIRDVGLVNQDAMCNIGSDHLFVDSLGVRSLGRVIQEKSTPIGEPSMNVSSEIQRLILENRDTVRLSHLQSKNMAVCLFPEVRTAYAFQLGQPSASGGYRVTRWTDCDWYDGITVRTSREDLTLLGGRDSRGILQYAGYSQPSPYTFSYEGSVMSASGNIMQNMIPKSVSYSFEGSDTSDLTARWGFGADLRYGRKAKGRGGSKGGDFRTFRSVMNGSGEMLRVGFDAVIDGEEISMQQITVNTMTGRVIL